MCATYKQNLCLNNRERERESVRATLASWLTKTETKRAKARVVAARWLASGFRFRVAGRENEWELERAALS